MSHYVVLDTNIYYELGPKFYKHPDYQNLVLFMKATKGALMLSTIVKQEFLNHYEQSLKKKLTDYEKSFDALVRENLAEGQSGINPKISKNISTAVKSLSDNLLNEPVTMTVLPFVPSTKVNGSVLTAFILSERNEGRKAEIRDFLIWDSICKKAVTAHPKYVEQGKRKKRSLSYYTFITKDKGFYENPHFKQWAEAYGADVDLAKSIPEYLQSRGYNLEFVKPELFLEKFTKRKLIKDLSEFQYEAIYNSINPFMRSQIPAIYPIVLFTDIESIKIGSFYSYFDKFDKEYKYVVELKAMLKVVYQEDTSSGLGKGWIKPENTFHSIAFYTYMGFLDFDKKQIKSSRLTEFSPIYHFDVSYFDSDLTLF
jgi:hypothetical protein